MLYSEDWTRPPPKYLLSVPKVAEGQGIALPAGQAVKHTGFMEGVRSLASQVGLTGRQRQVVEFDEDYIGRQSVPFNTTQQQGVGMGSATPSVGIGVIQTQTLEGQGVSFATPLCTTPLHPIPFHTTSLHTTPYLTTPPHLTPLHPTPPHITPPTPPHPTPPTHSTPLHPTPHHPTHTHYIHIWYIDTALCRARAGAGRRGLGRRRGDSSAEAHTRDHSHCDPYGCYECGRSRSRPHPLNSRGVRE